MLHQLFQCRYSNFRDVVASKWHSRSSEIIIININIVIIIININIVIIININIVIIIINYY